MDEHTILTTRPMLTWSDLVVYSGYLVCFWMDVTAQQVLQVVLIHASSWKESLKKVWPNRMKVRF